MILAVDEKNGIGKNNNLCWKLKWDMTYFKEITSKTKDKNKKNALIMWRKTWESIPKQFKPLKDRYNIILTRDINYKIEGENTFVFNSFEESLLALEQNEKIENIFLIWGATLYNEFLDNKNLKKVFITKVNKTFKCDTFFKGLSRKFKLKKMSKKMIEDGISYQFLTYKK